MLSSPLQNEYKGSSGGGHSEYVSDCLAHYLAHCSVLVGCSSRLSHILSLYFRTCLLPVYIPDFGPECWLLPGVGHQRTCPLMQTLAQHVV